MRSVENMCRRLLMVVALVAAGACSSDDDESGSDPARQALDEVVGWLADPQTADAEAFADAFIQQVPIEDLRQVLTEIGTGSWTAADVESIGARSGHRPTGGPWADARRPAAGRRRRPDRRTAVPTRAGRPTCRPRRIGRAALGDGADHRLPARRRGAGRVVLAGRRCGPRRPVADRLGVQAVRARGRRGE